LESSLIVEYSRMQLPSLSRGCEIAQFFVRHTDHHASILCYDSQTSWRQLSRTSPCATTGMHHVSINVRSTDTSSCYHLVTLKQVETTESHLTMRYGWHARPWTRNTHNVSMNLWLPNEDSRWSETLDDSKMSVCEALFKVVSTLFGLRVMEKRFESMYRASHYAFQNLRLGSINVRYRRIIMTILWLLWSWISMLLSSCDSEAYPSHVGKNTCETYPRRIGQAH